MKLSRLVVCVGGLFAAAVVGCGDDTAVVGGAGGTASVSTASSSKASGSVTHASVSAGEGGTGGAAAVACNPVTGAPCTGGQACDLNQDQAYTCFDPPNTQALCETCDPGSGPYCENGLHCFDDGSGTGKCMKFCCSNDDCGGGTCDTTQYGDPAIGLCGDPGGGGAGGGAIALTPVCTGIPATPPSNGTCAR